MQKALEKDKHDPHALNLLGIMVESGEGLPKNPKKARACNRKAARQGNHYAQASYGDLLVEGSGGKRDYTGQDLVPEGSQGE